MMERVIQIRTDNTVTVSAIDSSLRGLQSEVGGFIQIVRPRVLRGNYVLVINEEGKLEGLPMNAIATGIYGEPNDFIVGNAILMKEKGENLVELSQKECDTLMAWITSIVSKAEKEPPL